MSVVSVEILPMLLVTSVQDLKNRQISKWPVIIWAVIGGVLRIVMEISNFLKNREVRTEQWIGVVIALAIIGIAYFTKEKIGYGDGIVILALSFYMELWGLLEILVIAGILCAITAVILLGIFHKKGNYEIPFIPFLALASAGYCISGMVGG